MPISFIQTGTNLGDRQCNLQTANFAIEQEVGHILKQSAIYETAAWGVTDQPNFLNQVLQVQTKLEPLPLLQVLLQIEQKMGRIRKEKWTARHIDLDILYYETTILHVHKLHIPHPEIQNRRFVLVPLTEVAPEFVHPVLHQTNAQLLAQTTDETAVKVYEIAT